MGSKRNDCYCALAGSKLWSLICTAAVPHLIWTNTRAKVFIHNFSAGYYSAIHSYVTSLPVTWMMGWSAHSAGWQVAPVWEERLLCWRAGMLCRGTSKSLLTLAKVKCKGMRMWSICPEERACRVGTELQSSATWRKVMEKTKPSSTPRCTVQGQGTVGTSSWLYGVKLQLVIWGEENSPWGWCAALEQEPRGAAAFPPRSPTSMSTHPSSLELSSVFSRRLGRMTPKVLLSLSYSISFSIDAHLKSLPGNCMCY